MDRNLTAFYVFFVIVGVVLIAVSILCLRIAMEVKVGTTHLTVFAPQLGAFGGRRFLFLDIRSFS